MTELCPCHCHTGGLDAACDVPGGCYANHRQEPTVVGRAAGGPRRTECASPGCGRPVPDQAYLCQRCGDILLRDVGRVADLRAALDDALARRTRIDRPPAPRRPEAPDEGAALGAEETLRVQPMPVDLDAAGHILELRRVLVGWADWIAAQRGLLRPLDTWQALGGWLADQVEWLRHHPQGPEAAAEIGAVVARVMRYVDRPPARWYAGPCATPFIDDDGLLQECQEDLYPESGARVIQCPACQAVHDLDYRREWLLAAAEDRLAHAELIARAVTTLDAQRVTSSQVRGWAHRGRLPVKGRDAQGRPLYRIGDVLDLARETRDPPRRAAGGDVRGA